MLEVKSIPAFNDNYIWLIQNSDGRCAVVDPGEASPVLAYLEQHQLTLDTILITHHHHDHIGGIAELVRQHPNLHIVGPSQEPVPTLTHSVEEGQSLHLFDHTFQVFDLPGHTAGHIGYYTEGLLFCGDVLFSAGCGRIFEGTPQQMFESVSKLAALPDETQVFCAHEYTASNVAFALAVEPDNGDLHQYRDTVNRLRASNQPTLPTTLKQERLINPFLRTDCDGVIRAVQNRTLNRDPLSIFTALREWKNEF